MQVALGLLFIVLHALALGALIGLVILGLKAFLDAPASVYVGMPAVFTVIFVYGKWVWTPLWKARVRRQNERTV